MVSAVRWRGGAVLAALAAVSLDGCGLLVSLGLDDGGLQDASSDIASGGDLAAGERGKPGSSDAGVDGVPDAAQDMEQPPRAAEGSGGRRGGAGDAAVEGGGDASA